MTQITNTTGFKPVVTRENINVQDLCVFLLITVSSEPKATVY